MVFLMADPKLTLNKWELAARLGVSEPTVTKYVREGCPVVSGGSNGVPYEFDLVAVKQWLDGVAEAERLADEERERQLDEIQTSLFGKDELPKVAGAEGLTPDQRVKLYRAEFDRMRLARERGELVLANDVRVSLSLSLSELRNRLRGLPDQLARTAGLAPDQAEALEKMIDDVLEDAVTEIQARFAVPAGASALAAD